MKKILLLLPLILILALAACGGSDPTATPEPAPEDLPTAVAATEKPATEVPPTEVPSTEAPPTEAPSTEAEGSYVDSLDHVPDPELVNKTWAWQRRDPNGNASAAITVSNPENYTLYFNEDGTYSAKMDCNNGAGKYATSDIEQEQRSIYMELGPMTMAICGDSSLDTLMVQIFGPVQSYSIEGNGSVLKFIWAAGGPIDYFLNVGQVDLPDPAEGAASGTVIAPDGVFLRTGPGTHYPAIGAAPFGETGEIIGVSEDSAWWLANAPNQPGGQVWVAAEFVEVTGAENVPVVAAPPLNPILTGTPWEWVSTTDPAQGTVAVNDPSRYIILFNEDGTAAIQADCNNVGATYTTDGNSITIVPGPSTMAACPDDSLDSQFLAQLSTAAIYFIDGGNLYLDQPADSGTMRFVPQGTPPPSEESPAGEVDGQTLYLISFSAAGTEQPVLAGTQITASFAGDVVTGNAGCNNYSGTLTPVSDYFTVGPIVTTQMFCSEPAGVMEQEQAYLAALEAVNGYVWERSRQADGTLVTVGNLYFALPDGGEAVLSFTTSP